MSAQSMCKKHGWWTFGEAMCPRCEDQADVALQTASNPETELSALRAKVAAYESRSAAADAESAKSYRELQDVLREVMLDRDAARRDLEAAQRFEVRHIGVDFDLDDGNWYVWDRVSGVELAVRGEQAAALAEARRLAGEK